VDVGHANTAVALVQHAVATGDTTTLAALSLPFGCADLDAALFGQLQAELLRKHGLTVPHGSKEGQRLLRASSQARKVLSANKFTDVVLECFGEDGRDYLLRVTREELETGVAAPLARLAESLRSVLVAAGVTDPAAVSHVELVGGGTCIPAVQRVIEDVLGEAKLRTTLDRTCAVAVGAALYRCPATEASAPADPATNARLAAWCAAEAAMLAQDEAIQNVRGVLGSPPPPPPLSPLLFFQSVGCGGTGYARAQRPGGLCSGRQEACGAQACRAAQPGGDLRTLGCN
jgi:hypothetical protein